MRRIYADAENRLGTLNAVMNADEAAAYVAYVREHYPELADQLGHSISATSIVVYNRRNPAMQERHGYPFFIFESIETERHPETLLVLLEDPSILQFVQYACEGDHADEAATPLLVTTSPTTYKIDLTSGTLSNLEGAEIGLDGDTVIEIEITPDGGSIVTKS